jgi:cardiolipin synthase
VGAALTAHRLLGHAEARITGAAGLLLLIIALAGLLWPLSVSIPLSVFCGWLAISLFVRTYKLYFRKNQHRETLPGDEEGPPP